MGQTVTNKENEKCRQRFSFSFWQDVKLDGSQIAVRISSPNSGQPYLVDVNFDEEQQPMSFQIMKKLPRGLSILFAGSQVSYSCRLYCFSKLQLSLYDSGKIQLSFIGSGKIQLSFIRFK
jgi:hypothetical protein